MIRIPALAAAAAVVAAAFVTTPAHAAGIQEARFTVTLQSIQTTKWTRNGPTVSDCQGAFTYTGGGTEVVRVDSGRPEKLLVRKSMLATTPQAYWGTFDWRSMKIVPGLISNVTVTRQGRDDGNFLPGYCASDGPKEKDYDCGARKGVASMDLSWQNAREVDVSAADWTVPGDFKNCPIVAPSEIDEGAWTDIIGKLSTKLLFGSKPRITLVAGKQYDYSDQYIDSKATTYVKIVLDRVG
jgi:hypothetical protein